MFILIQKLGTITNDKKSAKIYLFKVRIETLEKKYVKCVKYFQS